MDYQLCWIAAWCGNILLVPWWVFRSWSYKQFFSVNLRHTHFRPLLLVEILKQPIRMLKNKRSVNLQRKYLYTFGPRSMGKCSELLEQKLKNFVLTFLMDHFRPLIRYCRLFYTHNCSIKVADDWIRTRVHRYRKRPSCQLCHNHTVDLLFFNEMSSDYFIDRTVSSSPEQNGIKT